MRELEPLEPLEIKKTATEETLRNIGRSLKRIEKILLNQTKGVEITNIYNDTAKSQVFEGVSGRREM